MWIPWLAIIAVPLVAGNWLHQCSPCIDQSMFSDSSVKSDIFPANTTLLYNTLRSIPLRHFTHVQEEFQNRFFSRKQLGVIADELKYIMPEAVSELPERRYTHINGSSLSQKKAAMVREEHLLFTAIGAIQSVGGRFEALDAEFAQLKSEWFRDISSLQLVTEETTGEVRVIKKETMDVLQRLSFLTSQLEQYKNDLFRTNTQIIELSADIAVVKANQDEGKRDLQGMKEEYLKWKVSEQFEREKFQEEVKEGNSAWKMKMADEFKGVKEEFRALKEASEGRIGVLEKEAELLKEVNRVMEQEHLKEKEAMTREITELSSQVAKLTAEVAAFDAKYQNEQSQLHEKLLTKELTFQEIKNEILQVDRDERQKLLGMDHNLTVSRLSEEREHKKSWDLHLVNITQEFQLSQEQRKQVAEMSMLEMKLEVEREKLKVDLATKVEEAKVREEAKLKDKRLNEDINLRELQAKSQEEREHTLQAIREVAGIIEEWLKSLYGSVENLSMVIGSVVALAIGVFMAREGSILLREQLNKHLGKPSLVRFTSRKTRIDLWMAKIKLFLFGKKESDTFNQVVLEKNLFGQIQRLANATKTAKERGAPLMHCMFYGPPGTGKTLTARCFAEYSGLEYAIMCGGDVAPLGDQAVTELHNLFKWIQRSRTGVVLFIDEAESFLAARNSGMSENLRNALTAMLYHTGTASSQFMMILATNRPGDLDAAIIDRMDESIEFRLPDFDERRKMVKLYYEKYSNQGKKKSKKIESGGVAVATPTKGSSAATAKPVTDNHLEEVAKKIVGFSGREISKLFLSIQTHAYAAGLDKVTPEMLASVTDQKLSEHNKSKKIQKNGYEYEMEAENIKASINNGGSTGKKQK
jgi:ATPase family AAA domain-containing protein 3A/B